MRKPAWLKSQKLGSKNTRQVTKKLREYNLHSVCESAKCPNLGECFERGTATFMILGKICTRNCAFCAVSKQTENISHPNPDEPRLIAELAKELNLKHIVITTVTRDDLPDSGASQFVKTINEIHNICNPNITIEVLISDLNGNFNQEEAIIKAEPDVLNHNVETIQRLYPEVRPMANYERSLEILKKAKMFNSKIVTKSGIMVGLGEKKSEVLSLMDDLLVTGVDILTIGQYMQPTLNHYPVFEYVHPDVFSYYKTEGLKKGFQIVESAPLVRSSYHAEKAREIIKRS
ncbi:MAG: lipoyl synthase [Candidatus Cloacimonetes bacterium]|nr:lipoyl synthase [Candidatus Cloacimonadota bacterium]